MRNLYLLILCFISLTVYSQQHLEGTVYDANTREPLMGAAVFYEGTTIGTITNEEGRFIIDLEGRSTSNIVITYLGYQDQVVPFKEGELEIYLKPKLENLDEVFIQANPPFTREEMLKAFKQQFLGTTTAGQSCVIRNEDAIFFYYDTDKNILHANADDRLVVKNNYLGYEIQYTLYKFQVNFLTRTLNPFDATRSYYAGTSFYSDLSNGRKKFQRRREKTYKGSTLELMRILATERYDKAPYTFYKRRFQTNPKQLFKVSDTLEIKKVVFENKIDIVYNKRERSSMRALTDYMTIDGYGNHLANSVVFMGTMGSERLGDALPLDFGLDEWHQDDE